jgi:hypothetical protein
MAVWLKVVIGAVTGSTLLVGGGLLTAMLVDLMDGTLANWVAMRTMLFAMWGLGILVIGTAYWSHSPRGREVWTDEQREALKGLKDGKI